MQPCAAVCSLPFFVDEGHVKHTMDVCQDKTVLASTQQHFYGTSRPLPDVAPVRRAGLGLVAPTVVIIAVVWVLGWARVAGLWPQPQVTTQSSLVPTRPLLWPQQGPRCAYFTALSPRPRPFTSRATAPAAILFISVAPRRYYRWFVCCRGAFAQRVLGGGGSEVVPSEQPPEWRWFLLSTARGGAGTY